MSRRSVAARGLIWCGQKGILPALVATIAVVYASLYFGATPSLLLCSGTFSTTVFCYGIDRYVDQDVGSAHSITRGFLLGSGACFVALSVAMFLAGRPWVGVLLLASPLSALAYASPWLGRLLGRGSQLRRIKDVPLFKSVYLAAYFSLLVPMTAYYVGGIPTATILAMMLFIFERMLQAAVACDFKDIESDRASGVITLPVYLGFARAHTALQILGAASFLLVLVAVQAGWMYPGVRWMGLQYIGLSVCLYKMSRAPADAGLYCAIVDALFLMWIPLGLLAR